ncbi:MAG TPA: epoxyqueuosine reductase QueH [candidate division Zixibacteria bacterium]|nr:epoxyqueuosine reductase QueH [candidate division Zixibacteria bacterium]
MKVLLHICCAPCAVMCVKSLRDVGFEVTGLWFNPSIHPFGEWKKRRQAVDELSASIDFAVIYNDYFNLEENLARLLAGSAEGDRCRACYSERLLNAAQTAKRKGFDAFCTSLLYSKYQNHSAIEQVGREAAELAGVEFLYRDFRPLWGRGITASKRMGLYRQRWCGCIFSEFEAEKEREARRTNSSE